MEVTAKRSLIERMIGAALLKVDVYEEVERDTTATSQAAIVVGVVAVASAVGGVQLGATGMIAGVLMAYVGWLLWSGITFFIGDKMFGGTATWGELLRTIGFAQAPGTLFFIGAFPILGWVVNLVVPLWLLVTGVIAIRQALDFTTGKAILTAFVGWLIIALLNFAVFSNLGLQAGMGTAAP